MKDTKRLMNLIVIAVCGWLAGMPAPAAEISGKWRAEFDTRIGQQKYLFTFQASGGEVTAKANAEAGGQQREVEFRDVKLEGDTLTFVEMRKFQDNEVRIDYMGKVNGQEIKFTRKVGDFGTQEFVAQRVGAGAPASPLNAAASDTASLKDVFKARFYVGTAINRAIATGTGGFNRRPEQLAKDIAQVKEQFNQVSPENDVKWERIHPREGKDGYDFGPADAFVNFGLSNHMYLVGHTLVWHAQTPRWVFAGTNPPPAGVTIPAAAPVADTNAPGTNRFGRGRLGFGPYTGPRASREELLQRMRDHIHTVVGRYAGKIKVWDVVNEAIADGGTNVLRKSLWFEIIGPDFIAKAFQYAHEADPDAILRYNDYSLENPAKRRKLISLIKSLQEQGVPVMAIGSQAHLNVSTSFEAMDEALTEMETLGLPIHITELDVNSAQGGQRTTGGDIASNAATTQGGLVSEADRKLADAYAGLFRAFIKHEKSVKLVTFWGPNDANSWRANGKPLLFDVNNQPKPAFDAVIAEAKKADAAK